MFIGEQTEHKIKIAFSGDREDFINTLKALNFILSNQNPDVQTPVAHLSNCFNLIDDMLSTL